MTDKEALSSEGAAGRALDVLEAFAFVREPMSLTELADRIGAPLSSCHNLMKTLQKRGYVYYVDQPRRFYPSKRILEVANAISTNDPLRRHLLPILTGLRDETGETTILGKLQGDEIIYLEVIEGIHVLRYQESPGARKPLHCSAIGKAILGTMSEESVMAFLRNHKLKRMTSRTIVKPALLLEDLRNSRGRGYYMTDGENVADVQAISIAFQFAGQTLAIALAAPSVRMKEYFGSRIDALRNCRLALEKLSGNSV